MYGYSEWQFTSPEAKNLYNRILSESSVLDFNSYTYSDLMIATENAYGKGEITPQEYERLNNFISICCSENSLKNEQDNQLHKKAVKDAHKRYNEKSALWKFFHKKMIPTAMNKLSTEELNQLYARKSR